MKSLTAVLLGVILSLSAAAQKVPAAVSDSFSRKFPEAKGVVYHDNLGSYTVTFVDDSVKKTARFNNKGVWKETLTDTHFEDLSQAVRDGFSKSKYATTEWKVTEAVIVNAPNSAELYRVRVEKNELQRKYLYFDKTGRLVRDNITL